MNQKPRADHFANYRELTIRGIILGAIITVIFTASNVYLGLKVGLTFASSIPAAVISMAVLKFAHDSNILENNMVQTQASAAGTLSSIIFVLPGLLMLGYWQDFPFWQTTFICLAGGILGVIFTIPLRHVMVVKSELPYPEGVAAAEILKAGAKGRVVNERGEIEQDGNAASGQESGVKEIVAGGLFAGMFSFLINGLRVAADGASYWFKSGNAIFQLPMGFSLALLGAGYLVGIVGGMAILMGIAMTWGILVPVLTSNAPMPADAEMAAYAMKIWKEQVRFIGAGTIGIAAIWTLISLAKPMWEGMRLSFEVIKNPSLAKNTHRAERDLSPKAMIALSLLMVVILIATFFSFVQAAPISQGLAWGLVLTATVLAVIIGFLVAAACGYMAGLIGSSSSPISGIGIVSVLLISLTFLVIGDSTGLLQNMSPDEAEAVIAHEISHIANGDMVTMTLIQGVVNTFVIFISRILAQLAAGFMGGNRDEGEGSNGNPLIYFAVATVLELVFGILASIITMWFSRHREFHADAGSAKLVGREKMIAALQRLKTSYEPQEATSMMAFCINGKSKSLSELFMTHPPLDKRIEALRSGEYLK